MLNKREFVDLIETLPKTISSKTRTASYTAFNLNGDVLSFQRVKTGKTWRLSIDDLYYIYRTNNFINTTVVNKATQGRVNSPSVAILMAIGCIDGFGNRI